MATPFSGNSSAEPEVLAEQDSIKGSGLVFTPSFNLPALLYSAETFTPEVTLIPDQPSTVDDKPSPLLAGLLASKQPEQPALRSSVGILSSTPSDLAANSSFWFDLAAAVPLPASGSLGTKLATPQSDSTDAGAVEPTATLAPSGRTVTVDPVDISGTRTTDSGRVPLLQTPLLNPEGSPAPIALRPNRGSVDLEVSPQRFPTQARLPSATADDRAQSVTSTERVFAPVNDPFPGSPAALDAKSPHPLSGSSLAASIAPPANAGSSTVKPDIYAELSSGAVPPGMTAEKKSWVADQPDVSSSPDVPPAILAGNATATPVPEAPPLDPATPVAISDSAPQLPKSHQLLDSAPPPLAAPAASGPSDANAQSNAQISAQMHVGVRSDAFGTVEIRSVVQQSQIGLTVHSDRDISRWFNSEVPSLESGLNKSHLNLTAVEFDSGGSGVQTATAFQQGQGQGPGQGHGHPRQSFSPSPTAPCPTDLDASGMRFDVLPTDVTASNLSGGPGVKRVSIHA